MTFLEQRFLRQFREDGDAYVVTRGAREVRFSPTEVAQFLDEWRRLWRAPWLWAGWLMLGVIAPVWIAWNGYPWGGVAFALVALLFVAAVLAPSWQKPGEVAQSRLPFEPDPEPSREPVRPTWYLVAAHGLFLLINGTDAIATRGEDLFRLNAAILWGGLFFSQAWAYYWSRRGRWPLEGTLRLIPAIVLGVAGTFMVIATALHPNPTGFDIVLAGLISVLAFAAAGVFAWRRWSPQQQRASTGTP